MKVLIIDDEQSILTMYGDRLKQEGFEVLTAPEGQAGIDMAGKEKPDVVLLDIIMPQLNGLDVLKILKEKPETKNIPVFLLTNLPQEASGEKAKQLGAYGYLVKAEYEPRTVVDTLRGMQMKK